MTKESPKDKRLKKKNVPKTQEDGMSPKDSNHGDRLDPDSIKSSGAFPPTRPHLHSKKLSAELSPVKATQSKRLSQKSTEVIIPNITVRKTGFRANRRKLSAAQQSEEPVIRKSRHSHCLLPKEILPPLIRSISFPQNKCDVKKHSAVSSPRRSGGDQRHDARFGVDKNRISQRVLSNCRKITPCAATERTTCEPEQNEKKKNGRNENTELVSLHSEKSFGENKTDKDILTYIGENISDTCTSQERAFSVSTDDTESLAEKNNIMNKENTKLEPLYLSKNGEESSNTSTNISCPKRNTGMDSPSSILPNSFEESKSATVSSNVSSSSPTSTNRNLEVPSKGIEREHLPHLQDIPSSRSQHAPCPIKEAIEQICSTKSMLEHVKYIPTMELASELRKDDGSHEDYVVKGKSIQSLTRIKSPLYASLEELGKQKTSEIYLKKLGKSIFLDPLPAGVKCESSASNKTEANLNKLSVLGVRVLQADQENKEIVQPYKEGEDSLRIQETSPQKVTNDKRKSPNSPLKDLYKFACKGVKFDIHGERIQTVLDESAAKEQQLYKRCKPQDASCHNDYRTETEIEGINKGKDTQNIVCLQCASTGNENIKGEENISSEVLSGDKFSSKEISENSPETETDEIIVEHDQEDCTYRYINEWVNPSQVGLKTSPKDDTIETTRPKIDGANIVVLSPRCDGAVDDDCDNFKVQFVGMSPETMERDDSLDVFECMVESGSNPCCCDDKTTKSSKEVSVKDNISFSSLIQKPGILLSTRQDKDLSKDNTYEDSACKTSGNHETVGHFTARSQHENIRHNIENIKVEVTIEESPSSLNTIQDKILDSIESNTAEGELFKNYEHCESPMLVLSDQESDQVLKRDAEAFEDDSESERLENINPEQKFEEHDYNETFQSTLDEYSCKDKSGSPHDLRESFGCDSVDENISNHFSDSLCSEGSGNMVVTVCRFVDSALDSSPDDNESHISEHACVSDDVIDSNVSTSSGRGSHSMYRSISKRNMLPVILEGEDTTAPDLQSTTSCKIQRDQLNYIGENYIDATHGEHGSLSRDGLVVNQAKKRQSLELFEEEISRPENVADKALIRACQNILMAKSMGELIQRKASLIMNRLYMKIESVNHYHGALLDSEEARNLEVETERFIRGLNTIFMTFHRIWLAENDFISCCDDKLLSENVDNMRLLSSVIAQDSEH